MDVRNVEMSICTVVVDLGYVLNRITLEYLMRQIYFINAHIRKDVCNNYSYLTYIYQFILEDQMRIVHNILLVNV